MTVPVPVVHLDPTGADHHGEAARLRAAGPVVRVTLPGGVRAYAITRHDLLADFAADSRVSKNWQNWNVNLPEGWPLTGMVKVTNMVTRDGAEHHRLRRLVTQTLTAGRVRALEPRITAITRELLDALPRHTGPDGAVDLRAHLAYPLPMRLICELVGVPDDQQPRMRKLVASIFDSTASRQEVLATQADIGQALKSLIQLRRDQPADDLTTALLTARDQDPDRLSDEELAGTLWVMITAGHETTLSLITNGIRAMLTHPHQRDLAVKGDSNTVWPAVVEETLRWDAPVGNFLARYPTAPISIAGVTIPAGAAVLAPWSAVGRDEQQHGPDADHFDFTREQSSNLAFGHGPHVCVGAPLARLEATTALRELFSRYPRPALAVPASALTPVPSLISNSVAQLPVHLGTPAN